MARAKTTVVAVILRVGDKICFSQKCWFVRLGIRCYGCPYIDVHGNIKDKRVGAARGN